MTARSRSDDLLIGELKQGRQQLLTAASSEKLLATLRRRLQSITRNLYILRWIPEQGEDLFDVLVDGSSVAHIEIPRASGKSQEVFQILTVAEYVAARKGMPKPERRKLELAIELARVEGP